ncbi:hypothetical protein PHLGIDRAFT_122466, partial [Phlebiopsis gigantea 11061_1 CR5-6]
LDAQPEWVVFNEFILTTRPYIRTVTAVQPEWLLEYAPLYFNLGEFKNSEMKRALVKVQNKRTGMRGTPIKDGKKKRKQRR